MFVGEDFACVWALIFAQSKKPNIPMGQKMQKPILQNGPTCDSFVLYSSNFNRVSISLHARYTVMRFARDTVTRLARA